MNTVFGGHISEIFFCITYIYKNFLSGLFKGNENSAILKCNYVKCINNCYNVTKTKI